MDAFCRELINTITNNVFFAGCNQPDVVDYALIGINMLR